MHTAINYGQAEREKENTRRGLFVLFGAFWLRDGDNSRKTTHTIAVCVCPRNSNVCHKLKLKCNMLGSTIERGE